MGTSQPIITGSILSDIDILAELDRCVITQPFNKDQLSPCSYDITLGDYYWAPNTENLPKNLNPDNGEHIFQYWGINPECVNVIDSGHLTYGASKAKLIIDSIEADQYGVDIGSEIIVIPPGHVILSHTREFIGSRKNVTTMLKAKSTTGRCCISIFKCAGYGDPGYFNRWTLEIENHSLVPVVLKVGQKIGQIVFIRTGIVSVPYSNKGQYQKTDNLEDLIKEWNPLCMIPTKAVSYLKTLLLKI